MKADCLQHSVKGKVRIVPSIDVLGQTVLVTGKWFRIAAVKDEDLCEGNPVPDPAAFVEELRQSKTKADIFVFAQKLTDTTPRFDYSMEWDNAAVIPVSTFAEWFEKKLSQDTRRNVRKATKMGVTVRPVPFDDALVRGIVSIYNETPIRQGRRFWHYGKDFETVKRENATYVDRSEFIGAFLDDQLIGFIKMVFVDRVASIMQILALNAHSDKKTANALIAKAVEIAEKKGASSLVYCKYVYGKNQESHLTEFKRRNGFEQVLYPRYFVPLTVKGRLIVALRLHRGLKAIIPAAVMGFLTRLRARLLELNAGKRRAAVAGGAS